jgi:hypothetical protein
MERIDMEVDDVEISSASPDLFQHREMMGHMVSYGWIETQSPLRAAHQLSGRLRIATSKERYLVPLEHKLLGEIRNDPLRPTVPTRWAALGKRSNLGDLHGRNLRNPTSWRVAGDGQ